MSSLSTSELTRPDFSEQARLKLLQIKEIAPPNGIAHEALRIMGDDEAGLSEIVKLIEQSPELTARILRCANSAYYGQRSHIDSVKDAVIRVLGLSVTKGLVLALVLSNSFDPRLCPGFQAERYWFIATVTGSLAQKLAPAMDLEDPPSPNAAYTAGLIHNLGLLALVHTFPKEMDQVFGRREACPASDKMLDLLGFDHQVAGSWLVQSWGLPQELVQVVAHYRDPKYKGPQWPMVNLIGCCAFAATALFTEQDLPTTEASQRLPFVEASVLQGILKEASEGVEEYKEMAHLLAGSGN